MYISLTTERDKKLAVSGYIHTPGERFLVGNHLRRLAVGFLLTGIEKEVFTQKEESRRGLRVVVVVRVGQRKKRER